MTSCYRRRMAKVVPGRSRAVVSHVPGGVRVVIPTRKRWFDLLFAPVWLVGWAMGEYSALGAIFGEPDGPTPWFLVLWLVIWTFGGVAVLGAFVYGAFGREVIEAAGGTLRVRREALGLGRTLEYAAHDVRRVRVSPAPNDSFSWPGGLQSWGSGRGLIAFDHGARTIRFCGGVEEAEAERIAGLLRERLPGAGAGG